MQSIKRTLGSFLFFNLLRAILFVWPFFLTFSEEKSLEEEFFWLCTQEINLDISLRKAYLEPNEKEVSKAKAHLKMDAPSYLVSVGSERSVFDLALACHLSGENCLGLIVRDIDPQIKAYIDFLILLLRISEDCADFRTLSTPPENTSKALRQERIDLIKFKLKQASLSPPLFVYYEKNLERYYTVYMEKSRRYWQLPPPSDFIDYAHEEKYFRLLQNKAKEGNIIAPLGDVNDLEFLSNKKIGVIDISNIPD